MEYIYAAMLLHKAGKKVDADSVKKVLAAAGVNADESRIKALVAALEGVNIDEAIEKAAVPVAVAAPAAGPEHAASQTGDSKGEDEKKAEEDKKSDEQAAAGLGALFG